jgi:hypothetical protein
MQTSTEATVAHRDRAWDMCPRSSPDGIAHGFVIHREFARKTHAVFASGKVPGYAGQ